MILEAVFIDGSRIKGIRPLFARESPGVHHLDVTETSDDLRDLIGCRVAVPVCGNTKYWILREPRK